MIQGVRLQKLSPQQLAFVGIYELMIDESQKIWNEISNSCGQQIRTNYKVSNLETKIKELENNILQLRQTLDRMVQDR